MAGAHHRPAHPFMIELEEAWRLLAETVAAVSPAPANPSLPVEAALGRVLAETVVARCDNPPFDQSAMDGIALSAALKKPGEPLACPVVATVAAGDVPDDAKPIGQNCVRIMTGAPIPSTCDTVVMVEDVSFTPGEPEIAHLQNELIVGRHIRRRGENIARGEVLAPAGTRVTAPMLAALLSQGVRRVSVRRPIRVGVATTGDEVVDYRRELRPGQIYNSNALAVAAALSGSTGTFALGPAGLGDSALELQHLGVLPDDLAETESALARCTDLDVVVVTGGVSMGEFDHVPRAAAQAGFQPLFHKVRMKPGKPVWFGKHSAGTLMLGLPGNPVSSLVGTLLFVQPLVRGLQVGALTPPGFIQLPLEGDVRNGGRLPLFVPARVVRRAAGFSVMPLTTSGSGDVTRFSFCQALLRVLPGDALKKGELVQVLLPFNP
ncbi:molybdopterin molybdotransferase MoeA [Acanthopleuribacter pedis]|uniref:Molybdopterin molybdenumtransferase n=1 Tax=Acanthopleuribacter pedis TaxID=442870 RepID=A0A8J7U4Q1_9BACT|nr:molybdopterin molybdotransferase MoeA [Acanthopleuribacter pedis]MBO1320024.1 molybdopterin molybdotransferase MoeA [Acanthopleuribacter pedis]